MDARLLQQLKGWNPWWQEGPKGIERFGVPGFKREAYVPIASAYQRRNQAVSIVGLRQVGKTTIMHQCIQELLEQGVPPRHIFYLSFEDSYLTAKYNLKTLFYDVIKLYAEYILEEDIASTEAKLYFFFDEVHRLPNWSNSIKTYYDQHMPIAFMVSGSASFGMQKGKGDSLLGRMVEFTLYPFSFHEAVMFWENEQGTDEGYRRLRNLLDACRSEGEQHFSQGNIRIFHEKVSGTYKELSVWYGQHLQKFLRRYILEGGFPRVWQQQDEYSKHRHLIEQHVQKVIREDLPQIAKVRKVRELESLYISLLDRVGEETVFNKLAQDINLSPSILEKYINYLRKTFLVFPVERTKTKNVLRQRRASRMKFYAMDAAVRAAILKNRADIFENSNEMGVYAENLVASALMRRLSGRVGSGIWYYRESNRHEVDFIVKEGDSLLPVEMKWRENIPALPSLDRLCQKWDLNESILVTKDFDLTYRNGRLSIPLWFFLLAF